MGHHGHPTPFQFCRPQFRPKYKIISVIRSHQSIIRWYEPYLDFSWGRFVIRIGWTDPIIDFFSGNGSSDTSLFVIFWFLPEIYLWTVCFLIGDSLFERLEIFTRITATTIVIIRTLGQCGWTAWRSADTKIFWILSYNSHDFIAFVLTIFGFLDGNIFII